MNDQATKLRVMAEAMSTRGIKFREQEESSSSCCAEDCYLPPVRTIAITSGKGGVGKTNIAANLGIAMATQNKKVCIIDADLGLANIDVILKLKPKYNIEHVISGEKKLEEIFVRGPAGLIVIPASSGRLSLANLPELDREELIREIYRSIVDFDIMFIDTAAGISQNVVDFALIAHEIIVITTPEPTAITDAYAMLKVISQLRKTDIGIIVNMADNPEQACEVADRIIKAARRYINAKAHYIGHILTDSAVLDAVFAQHPLIFRHPESKAAVCINALADKILVGVRNAQR